MNWKNARKTKQQKNIYLPLSPKLEDSPIEQNKTLGTTEVDRPTDNYKFVLKC